MRSKKGQLGWMAIKIDLEKAYDKLKWDFIKGTLMDIGLPNNFFFFNLVLYLYPKMRLLWNGEVHEEV